MFIFDESDFEVIVGKLGYTITEYRGWSLPLTIKKQGSSEYYLWNPLMDDGDALRVAAELHISYRFYCSVELKIQAYDGVCESAFVTVDSTPIDAIRKAIFRVAATPYKDKL